MPNDSGSLRSALLRAHWLDVQRHIYAHSAHGYAMDMPGGWLACAWRRDARATVLLIQRDPFARLEPALRFIEPLRPEWTIMVETEGEELDGQLTEAGFEPDYLLPGHFIPVTKAISLLARSGERDLNNPFGGDRAHARYVTNLETLGDFAYVQDQAYRATYDWPKGCASLFYTDPGSLIGPDSLGVVLYLGDMPVRTAALIHKRGIVAGVAGAAVPDVRGRHLGEILMGLLLFRARELWGAEHVHHITMPCARPIAARLGLEHVTTYYRWRLP